MNIAAIASNLTPPVRATAETGAAGGKPDASAADASAQRRKVAGQFEAILVRQMLSKSVGSMLGSSDSVSASVYGDMMTEVLAENLTAGPGLGMGRLIEQQLSPRGSSAAAPAPSSPSSSTSTTQP